MRTDIGNVGHPCLIWLCHIKLLLQVVWGGDGYRPGFAFQPAKTITDLCLWPCTAHQAKNPVRAASLAVLPQVCVNLAITIDTATFNPELLDKPEKVTVIFGSGEEGFLGPGIVAAGVHLKGLTQLAYRIAHLVPGNKGVPHSWCLAKYAAAFFKVMSSSETRLNSALSRRISASASISAWYSSERGLYFFSQAYRL